LLADLARQPTLLLLTPGHAQRQVTQAPHPVRLKHLPYLSQRDFDRLLWSADLNFVRGEDSLVRALWAGVPFVWQAYPQDDGAHGPKLEALMDQWRPAPEVATFWRAWNGLPGAPWAGLPPLSTWQPGLAEWRQRLLAQDDLATQLLAFARGKTQT
jgi:uncharacterized repeat protein (TIGR03837 family)